MTGESPHVSQGYSPMVVRFFMLQSHYRSTLDLTDEALQAAQKGYNRLMEGYRTLMDLPSATGNAPGKTGRGDHQNSSAPPMPICWMISTRPRP